MRDQTKMTTGMHMISVNAAYFYRKLFISIFK
jgi:hypothetical protein